MKFQRERWTPLTIVIETREEAEVLHKILGTVDDPCDVTEDIDLYGLFMKLGEGLTGESKFTVGGSINISAR